MRYLAASVAVVCLATGLSAKAGQSGRGMLHCPIPVSC